MSPVLASTYGIAIVLGLSYRLLIDYFLRQWHKLPVWQSGEPPAGTTKVTVLVPARNEEKTIGACLQSILRQSYPAAQYEVIVIDDHSTDGTSAAVTALNYPNLRLIRLQDHLPSGTNTRSFKKKALEAGVARATGELILTTDADCRVPPDWIALIVACYRQYRPAFIAAPVNFYGETNTLEKFQSLDFLGTMILTGAGIQAGWMHLANGANLAFPKYIFEAVGAYRGVDHLASGDDMLLLHKIAARFPDNIAFLKSAAATVHTRPKPDWPSFLRQRLRWASKSNAYKEWQVTGVQGLVFVLCWSILLSPLLVILFGLKAFGVFLILLFLKVTADYRLLTAACRFFKRPRLIRSFPVSQVFHILYIAVAGLLGNVVKEYEWKGRRVR
jgi:cellulose synthase/poly-beta-1,6-N-acetylglucosamine synthase-like glycosyltransferase